MLGAIILAAGESKRMGCPKALLKLGDRTFLEAVLHMAAQIGVEEPIVVLGANARKVFSSHDLSAAKVVWTSEISAGPIGSIRRGITALNRAVEGVVILHVDRPHVSVGTVLALAETFATGQAQIVIPQFAGRRGHPVIFGRAVFDELLGAPATEGARSVVRADPTRVVVVPVDDPAILEDINTPESYRALLKRLGQDV